MQIRDEVLVSKKSAWDDRHFAVVGRVKTFLNHPEKGLYPASCTVKKYSDFIDTINYADVALRGGAGINIVLDSVTHSLLNSYKSSTGWYWQFTVDAAHPEHKNIKDSRLSEYFNPMSDSSTSHSTTIVVNDSMEEDSGDSVSIKRSWGQFFNAAIAGKCVVLDLSKIRPAGTVNEKGLYASGPLSFLTIYEAIANLCQHPTIETLMNAIAILNEVLRRGGQFKNGIVTFSMSAKSPLINDYLDIPLKNLIGSAKKGIRLDDSVFNDKHLIEKIVERVNSKSLYLEKIQGNNLYSNVCREILILSEGICVLSHHNMGQYGLDVTEFEEYFTLLAKLTCVLAFNHDRHSQYLPASEDKQIGIGVIGLANWLAIHKIRYRDFIYALNYAVTQSQQSLTMVGNIDALKAAQCMISGFNAAAVVGREYGLERMFTLAPTQTCAYNHTDSLGFTCAKNINPPLSRAVRRRSQVMTEMNKIYNHGQTETISELMAEDPNLIQMLWESWQMMIDATGLAHSLSYDLYHQIDVVWFDDFMKRSPLKTTYYMFADAVDQSYLNKSVIPVASDRPNASCDLDTGCVSCAE